MERIRNFAFDLMVACVYFMLAGICTLLGMEAFAYGIIVFKTLIENLGR